MYSQNNVLYSCRQSNTELNFKSLQEKVKRKPLNYIPKVKTFPHLPPKKKYKVEKEKDDASMHDK